ncbi:ATP-binding protein [Streptantibioticus parmotrematis]|nr:ATP-binding protein [Streptantibioticus parmotrematis]
MTLVAESPDTVRAARNMTGDALEEWGLSFLVDDARLVVSELVGNVVHHAVPDDGRSCPGAPRRIDVALRQWPKWLFIEVVDEDSTPPSLPAAEAFSPDLSEDLPEALLPDSGRGLLIIQRLADALWWSPEASGGKTVVCRFDLPAGAAASPAG